MPNTKKHTFIKLTIAALLSVATCSVFAQKSSVTIQHNIRLDSLVEKTIEHNKTVNGIQGYRVQIFFGSERKAATDAKTKFMQLMPSEEVYLIYQQPYFKVRVGDYRTKIEAQAMYQKLISDFDKAFIIPDKINLPKL